MLDFGGCTDDVYFPSNFELLTIVVRVISKVQIFNRRCFSSYGTVSWSYEFTQQFTNSLITMIYPAVYHDIPISLPWFTQQLTMIYSTVIMIYQQFTMIYPSV